MDKPADLSSEMPQNPQQLALLQEQYHDYFVIEHRIHANIRPLEGVVPDAEQFLKMIPEPFLMAGELAALDRSALKPLAKLGEMAEELALYLRAQAKKIDIMMRYILMQQDDPQHRCFTHSYGGSALCYYSNCALQPLQLIEVKLFLEQSDGAVYCLAQVISCESTDSQAADGQFLIKATLCQSRDEDRELIVRASLHQQSRQLKRKAEMRQSLGNL
jgi:hypothetical protein